MLPRPWRPTTIPTFSGARGMGYRIAVTLPLVAGENRTLDKARLEAFSDGVFAIAITLLVLDLPVPRGNEVSHLASYLGGLWPVLLSFVASFAVLLVFWITHQRLFALIERVDTPLLWANGAVLLTSTFMPFPTGVLGASLASGHPRDGIVFYCGSLLLVSISFRLLLLAIARGPRPRDRTMRDRTMRDKAMRDRAMTEDLARVARVYDIGLAARLGGLALAFALPVVGLAVFLATLVGYSLLSYPKSQDAPGRESPDVRDAP